MKKPSSSATSFLFLCLLSTSTLFTHAHAQTSLSAHEVTANEYCNFLNAVAADDIHKLYDDAMGSDPDTACIARTGAPGQWHYEVITGRENDPITCVDWFDEARYCNWLQNNQPSGEQGPETTEDGSYTLSTTSDDVMVPKNPVAAYFLADETEGDSNFQDDLLIKSSEEGFSVMTTDTGLTLEEGDTHWNTNSGFLSGVDNLGNTIDNHPWISADAVVVLFIGVLACVDPQTAYNHWIDLYTVGNPEYRRSLYEGLQQAAVDHANVTWDNAETDQQQLAAAYLGRKNPRTIPTEAAWGLAARNASTAWRNVAQQYQTALKKTRVASFFDDDDRAPLLSKLELAKYRSLLANAQSMLAADSVAALEDARHPTEESARNVVQAINKTAVVYQTAQTKIRNPKILFFHGTNGREKESHVITQEIDNALNFRAKKWLNMTALRSANRDVFIHKLTEANRLETAAAAAPEDRAAVTAAINAYKAVILPTGCRDEIRGLQLGLEPPWDITTANNQLHHWEQILHRLPAPVQQP